MCVSNFKNASHSILKENCIGAKENRACPVPSFSYSQIPFLTLWWSFRIIDLLLSLTTFFSIYSIHSYILITFVPVACLYIASFYMCTVLIDHFCVKGKHWKVTGKLKVYYTSFEWGVLFYIPCISVCQLIFSCSSIRWSYEVFTLTWDCDGKKILKKFPIHVSLYLFGLLNLKACTILYMFMIARKLLSCFGMVCICKICSWWLVDNYRCTVWILWDVYREYVDHRHGVMVLKVSELDHSCDSLSQLFAGSKRPCPAHLNLTVNDQYHVIAQKFRYRSDEHCQFAWSRCLDNLSNLDFLGIYLSPN